MDRRGFLAGVAALSGVPGVARAEGARRVFRILRDGSDIGRHSLVATLGTDGFTIEIDIDIRVRFLGITAYRYEMNNREVWAGGRLVALDARTDDDGTRDRAMARSAGGGLDIDGSRYSGQVPADAVTTSYFATPFLERRPWISTQSGDPLDISVAPEGRQNWYGVSGDLTTTLGYDARGEWTGCEFDAGGEIARYDVIEDSGTIGDLWARA